MEYIHCDLAMEVAKYLTPKDISTCCSVSLHWREVFGSNEVWKRLCDSKIEEYLRTTPCVVEPKFQLPQHLGTSLTALSQWRAAFLREQHLWTNWQNGNFKTVEYDWGYENTNCSIKQFVTNDLIIRFLNNSVELWDIRADCPVLKDTISSGTTRWYYWPTILENGIVAVDGYNDNGYNHDFLEILKVNLNESTVIVK
ncbi:F-box/WD repeat-containing protein 7-like isoform X3 [Macrosteles quadrilineatus]|uniref:F-box/WD repeat-containing protein 7-like isoform X3 n=1 Tax=Macrosteles quadrilineatus TaxID=74068 RepID=UPI0023E158D7|nr:F-box/WD repeat-containing protein 7-like isoform X3 [Macrosteles quadrilineatus]